MNTFLKVIDSKNLEHDTREDEVYLTSSILAEDEAEPESMGAKERWMPLDRVVHPKLPDITMSKLESPSAASRKAGLAKGKTKVMLGS